MYKIGTIKTLTTNTYKQLEAKQLYSLNMDLDFFSEYGMSFIDIYTHDLFFKHYKKVTQPCLFCK